MYKLFKNVNLDNTLTDILVKDNIIQKIAPGQSVPEAEVFDADAMIIIPSFANAHTHAAMTLMRGYADDLELFDWLSNYIWPLEAKLTEDDVYWAARLACLEMIKCGTTCFNDMYWHCQETARAAEDAGIRAVISQVFIDHNDAKESQRQIVKAEEFLAKHADTERVKYALGPHAIYTVSHESLRWIAEYSHKHNRLVHIHIAETKKEVADSLEKFGLTPVEYLASLNLINKNSLLAHCVWLTDNEARLISEAGATVLHNPVSNLKLASGYFPYELLKKHNVRIAIGTDGCSSNNNLSSLEEMKFAALLPKYIEMNPQTYPAEEVFRDATKSAFDALQIDAGEIKEGKLADFVLINNNSVFLTPNYNIISDLVYSADSSVVDTVVCNGKIIMNRGVVADEEIIVNKVKEIRNNLLKR